MVQNHTTAEACKLMTYDLAASANSYDCFLSSFQIHNFYTTVIRSSETRSSAFQCIAQPNTTFA